MSQGNGAGRDGVSYDDVQVGDEIPPLTATITRAGLVRYAGASGDFNPIHWNERFAKDVGLPDVLAHGMLTMAIGGRAVTDWVGDPGALVDYGVRFTHPVVVPDGADGALVEVTGKVKAKNDDDGTVRVDVIARAGGHSVLGRAQAIVRLRAARSAPESADQDTAEG